MKYIRTKDGRILYASDKIVDGYYGPHSIIVGGKGSFEGRVLKEADTIEELCDEFVLVHTEYDDSKDIFEATRRNGTWLSHRGDNYYSFGLEQVRNGSIDIKGSVLYGAIWTDKGLIYVVKMNEKGEWELL